VRASDYRRSGSQHRHPEEVSGFTGGSGPEFWKRSYKGDAGGRARSIFRGDEIPLLPCGHTRVTVAGGRRGEGVSLL